ncbi:hypothetical protein DRH14_01060 [Candidatus Shapirobacteria bacterium]|nr:MAG: hypothetical protein DRH14_01060 [Candidatus Shapirobacteria bacterium]
MSKDKGKWSYRLIFELSPSLKDADRDAIFDAIEDAGKEFAFVFDQPVSLGVKNLVYKIRKFDKLELWEMKFKTGEEAKMDGFNVFLNRQKRIMRYLILKI